MFETLIVQPIFNLLVLIYALIPGHNFGLAIIIFTIVVRLLMWPLVKKQLHHTREMRKLQPELKRIKKEAKGDRQRQQLLMMELYKERHINPFAPLGLVLVQAPIFFGLFFGLRNIVENPNVIVDNAYPFIRNLGTLKELAVDITRFDSTLFGVVDLTRTALGEAGVYWPAMVIVIASAVMQYFQSKQLTPQDKDARGLRQIMREAGQGKESDQEEVNAAIGRMSMYFLPALIFFISLGIAAALPLYWFVGGVVAYLQQRHVLSRDETELESIASRPASTDVIEGEVIDEKPKTKSAKKAKKTTQRKKKRRR